MLTKEIIDQFYKDVEALGLEHPVAALQGDRYANKRFKIAKPGWRDLKERG
jgi:hypothetical protein